MNLRPTRYLSKGRPPFCNDLCECGGAYFIQHTSKRNGLIIRYARCNRCGKKRKPIISIPEIREKALTMFHLINECHEF
jgi:hypothetical protein